MQILVPLVLMAALAIMTPEREYEAGLNPGFMVPAGESHQSMGNSSVINLSGDWWITDGIAAGVELGILQGHKIPNSPRGLLRPTPVINFEKVGQEAAADIIRKGGGEVRLRDARSGVTRTGWYAAPTFKLGRLVEMDNSFWRPYFSFGGGLHHSEYAGSLTVPGTKLDGGAYSESFPIEKKKADEFGLNLGVGITWRPKKSRLLLGLDVRYHRIIKDGAGSPDVFLAPSMRLGYTF